jgi:hypothetical protein
MIRAYECASRWVERAGCSDTARANTAARLVDKRAHGFADSLEHE